MKNFELYQCARVLSPDHGWGFHTLRLSADALMRGSIAVERARGVLADGSAFSIPDQVTAPASIRLAKRDRSVEVALVLSQADEQRGGSSHVERKFELQVLEQDLPVPNATALSALKVARVLAWNGASDVVLDSEFIPPVLDLNASAYLKDRWRDLRQLVVERCDVLASRLEHFHAGSGTVFSWYELLQLQALNRHRTEHALMVEDGPIHPTQLYRALRLLASDLTVFSRRPSPDVFPPRTYRHHDLEDSFKSLIGVIEDSLRSYGPRADRRVERILLQERARGLYTASLNKSALDRDRRLVIAVKTSPDAAESGERLPWGLTIAPATRIRDIVYGQKVGMAMTRLESIPPIFTLHIAAWQSHAFFLLDADDPLWSDFHNQDEQLRLLAFFVDASSQSAKIELWNLAEETLSEAQ